MDYSVRLFVSVGGSLLDIVFWVLFIDEIRPCFAIGLERDGFSKVGLWKLKTGVSSNIRSRI